MPRRALLVGAFATAVVALAGCSSEKDPTTGGDGPVDSVAITIEGDQVSPNGKRIDVKAGDSIDLEITSDQPGELHLHSTPELVVEFEAGTSTHPVTFHQPGVVEVESHELEKVIVQLVVR